MTKHNKNLQITKQTKTTATTSQQIKKPQITATTDRELQQQVKRHNRKQVKNTTANHKTRQVKKTRPQIIQHNGKPQNTVTNSITQKQTIKHHM